MAGVQELRKLSTDALSAPTPLDLYGRLGAIRRGAEVAMKRIDSQINEDVA